MPSDSLGVVPLPVPAGTLIRLASIRLFGFYRGSAPRTTATLRRAFLVQQQAREASLTMLQSNTKEVLGMMPASARLVLVGLVLLTAAPSSTSAVSKLPHYVTACSRSDPKINACVLKTGKHAIPFIINGDPKYRVPKLNPLVIPELELQQGSGPVGLRLSWKNAELHGLKDADFQEVDLNVKKMHLRMGFFLPKLSIIGTYSAKGRVLLLPVTGSGPSNITVQRMKISYDIDYKVVNRSNGREYLEVYNPKVTLHDIGFMSLKFENLFNGERRLGLGNELNVFLNENWKDLAKEFGPGVADAVGQVFQLILKNICDIVPYELVLKP